MSEHVNSATCLGCRLTAALTARLLCSNCSSTASDSSGTIQSAIASLSKLGRYAENAVPPPTLRRVMTPAGPLWVIETAGMCLTHQQDWQALWLWEQALLSYYGSADALRGPR